MDGSREGERPYPKMPGHFPPPGHKHSFNKQTWQWETVPKNPSGSQSTGGSGWSGPVPAGPGQKGGIQPVSQREHPRAASLLPSSLSIRPSQASSSSFSKMGHLANDLPPQKKKKKTSPPTHASQPNSTTTATPLSPPKPRPKPRPNINAPKPSVNHSATLAAATSSLFAPRAAPVRHSPPHQQMPPPSTASTSQHPPRSPSSITPSTTDSTSRAGSTVSEPRGDDDQKVVMYLAKYIFEGKAPNGIIDGDRTPFEVMCAGPSKAIPKRLWTRQRTADEWMSLYHSNKLDRPGTRGWDARIQVQVSRKEGKAGKKGKQSTAPQDTRSASPVARKRKRTTPVEEPPAQPEIDEQEILPSPRRPVSEHFTSPVGARTSEPDWESTVGPGDGALAIDRDSSENVLLEGREREEIVLSHSPRRDPTPSDAEDDYLLSLARRSPDRDSNELPAGPEIYDELSSPTPASPADAVHGRPESIEEHDQEEEGDVAMLLDLAANAPDADTPSPEPATAPTLFHDIPMDSSDPVTSPPLGTAPLPAVAATGSTLACPESTVVPNPPQPPACAIVPAEILRESSPLTELASSQFQSSSMPTASQLARENAVAGPSSHRAVAIPCSPPGGSRLPPISSVSDADDEDPEAGPDPTRLTRTPKKKGRQLPMSVESSAENTRSPSPVSSSRRPSSTVTSLSESKEKQQSLPEADLPTVVGPAPSTGPLDPRPPAGRFDRSAQARAVLPLGARGSSDGERNLPKTTASDALRRRRIYDLYLEMNRLRPIFNGYALERAELEGKSIEEIRTIIGGEFDALDEKLKAENGGKVVGLEVQITALRARLDKALAEATTSVTTIGELHQTVQEREESIQKLEDRLLTSSTTVSNLRDDRAAKDTEIAALKEQLKAAQETSESKQATIDALLVEADAQREYVRQTSARAEDLVSQLEAEKLKNSNLRRDVEAAAASSLDPSATASVVAGLEARLAAAEKLATERLDLIGDLKTERAAAVANRVVPTADALQDASIVADLQARLASVEAIAKERLVRIDELETESDLFMADAARAADDTAKHAAAKAELQARLASVESVVQEQVARISSLQSAVDVGPAGHERADEVLQEKCRTQEEQIWKQAGNLASTQAEADHLRSRFNAVNSDKEQAFAAKAKAEQTVRERDAALKEKDTALESSRAIWATERKKLESQLTTKAANIVEQTRKLTDQTQQQQQRSVNELNALRTSTDFRIKELESELGQSRATYKQLYDLRERELAYNRQFFEQANQTHADLKDTQAKEIERLKEQARTELSESKASFARIVDRQKTELDAARNDVERGRLTSEAYMRQRDEANVLVQQERGARAVAEEKVRNLERSAVDFRSTLADRLSVVNKTREVLEGLVAAVRKHRKVWGLVGEQEARETMWTLGRGAKEEVQSAIA